MKLRFERFEGLCCFSIRGPVTPLQHRVLEVGLETLAKSLKEPLVVNMMLAEVSDPSTISFLTEVKKKIAEITKLKIQWITPHKPLGDYAALNIFTSRLTGFKTRQIGERIAMDDDVYELQLKVQKVESRILELGGDHDRARAIILENRVLKEQFRILHESIEFQQARMGKQTRHPSEDEESVLKIKTAQATFQSLNPVKVNL